MKAISSDNPKLIADFEEREDGYRYKTRWLDEDRSSDFHSFKEWIDFVVDPATNAASISSFIEIDKPGFDNIDFSREYKGAIEKFRPIYDAIYKDFKSDDMTVEDGIKYLQNDGCNYWWLNANPRIWDFASVQIGETQTYTARNDKGNKRQKYKYFEEARPGDLVLGYVANPTKQLVSLSEITEGMA